MFLVNSRRAFFCCNPAIAGQGILHSLRPVSLPISLIIFLPIALVYSTHPPVSVLVRIPSVLVATLFSSVWGQLDCPVFTKLLFVLHFKTKRRICQSLLAKHLKVAISLPLPTYHSASRPNLKRTLERIGILTDYPSATPIITGLTLGSPNPQSNNVAVETLDVSALRILIGVSLLMPAFSLVNAPASLTANLHRPHNALLPSRLTSGSPPSVLCFSLLTF